MSIKRCIDIADIDEFDELSEEIKAIVEISAEAAHNHYVSQEAGLINFALLAEALFFATRRIEKLQKHVGAMLSE